MASPTPSVSLGSIPPAPFPIREKGGRQTNGFGASSPLPPSY